MIYNIIGLSKNEYYNGDYPTKYYLHVVEFPHIIQITSDMYNFVSVNAIESINFPQLKVTSYNGKFYYKDEADAPRKEEN